MERLLAAAAARVILLSFAADNRELASIKVANGDFGSNLSCIHVSVNLASPKGCGSESIKQSTDSFGAGKICIVGLVAWKL